MCHFCAIAAGGRGPLTGPEHVVLRTEAMTAFVASDWSPANPGHVLVIPNPHVENLYELPLALGGPLVDATQRIAIALKRAYGCDGVSTRQHNEPAGNQTVWHLHQHVLPRWHGDRLYQRHDEKAPAPPDERLRRVEALRAALELGAARNA